MGTTREVVPLTTPTLGSILRVVAPETDHPRVEEPPKLIWLGEAVNWEMVGGGAGAGAAVPPPHRIKLRQNNARMLRWAILPCQPYRTDRTTTPPGNGYLSAGGDGP